MKGPYRELNDVLPVVRRGAWERDELAFLGTSFAFRRQDRFLTAAHCVVGIPPHDLLIVDLDELMEVIEVEHIEFHPQADIAVLFTKTRYRERTDFFYDTHNQFMPGESFTSFGYPAELSGRQHDFPVGRLFRGHFQRFYSYEMAEDINPLSRLPYRYVAGEMSIGTPRGLSGGPIFARESQYALGLVTANLEAYTERRRSVDLEAGGTRYVEVESAVINYGVALLLSRVRDWLDVHAPRT